LRTVWRLRWSSSAICVVERPSESRCRTYVTTARGLEPGMAYYGLLDRTPRGRHEEGEQEHWLRRHDEYGT
jgi:predicted dithiol-disulfide oxidoreductase (DUF899 family)